VSLAGEADVPTTLPVAASSFEAFLADLRSPGSPPDRVWLARDRGSGAVLGMSWLVYPATAGDVWTAWTTVARAARGRGLGLALKVETVLQAMELGVRRVRTENDQANLPILRLNEAMGYRPIAGQVQLLKPA
jgi:GNAT superfamily N-acetyltransferase